QPARHVPLQESAVKLGTGSGVGGGGESNFRCSNSSGAMPRFAGEFSASSYVTALPVYADMRPMVAISVELHMYPPLSIASPLRIAAKSASCSFWYMSSGAPSSFQRHACSPQMVAAWMFALPFVPNTKSETSVLTSPALLPHWRQLEKRRSPLFHSKT